MNLGKGFEMLFFCEECGEKVFLEIKSAAEQGKTLSFRCRACHYLNRIAAPPGAGKTQPGAAKSKSEGQ
ncbi:hypothetical protein [Desulfurivibrio sp. C05AmB]|jgi:hypothetical protein|uniref:hypothetical protein n=1 Tax=Desulfurivibrio sp. C05AmB TaxID=3374371 RepID=UPI00376EF753